MKKIKGLHKLDTSPYPSCVYITDDVEVYYAAHIKIFGVAAKELRRFTNARISDGDDTEGRHAYLIYMNMLYSCVHELSHLCLDIFNSIGADPSECNGEPYCYLIGNLFRQTQEFFPDLK
jgi:hypothetical protein